MTTRNSKTEDLSLSVWASLISKMINDFAHCVNGAEIPDQFTYTIPSEIGKFTKQAQLVKQAFDTRRINQETERNPREGLQNYHRSEPYILSDQQTKINTLAKLLVVSAGLKDKFGATPDWHNSYSRVLYDNLQRTLATHSDGTYDPSDAQFNYLEQLLETRYRLSFEQIDQSSLEKLSEIVLGKDEKLLKRGIEKLPLQSRGVVQQPLSINGLEGLIGQFRQAGEKTVERTITITIRDQVIE